MEYFAGIVQSRGFRRFCILCVVGLFLYLMRHMVDMLLLTFIFTFLMYSMQNFLITRLKNVVRVHQRVMIAFLYLVLAGAIAFGLYKFIPSVVTQSMQVINLVTNFYIQPHDSPVLNYIIDATKEIKLQEYTKQSAEYLLKYITNIGKWGVNIFIALILSLFFLLEKSRIQRFTSKFKTSKLAPVYEEIEYFGGKFLHSFGKVIEAQILIAIVNAILSTIALSFMGFPQVLGLAIMILVLGLIPVAGVMISLVPLCMIAFNIGGVIKVVYVLVMVAVLHALEAYVLNPKLMSSKTELPVFYTFIILIVSEHFMGVWGLIIGIPIFMFVLDVLEVDSREEAH